MRKLERQMNFAISNKSDWCGSNTQVNYNSNTNCSSVYLHGHLIATYEHNLKAVKLSSCGYETVTTKSRLNALCYEFATGFSVFQKNWEWFISDFKNVTKEFVDNTIVNYNGCWE